MVSREGRMGVLATALGAAAVLAMISPASAGGGGVSDRDVERAREACREIARNRDWKVDDTHLRDKDDDRKRVTIVVQGDRRGEGKRERTCVYNVRSGDAEFDDQ